MWRNVYRASHTPFSAQCLAPVFGSHTCPKAAFPVPFHSALAMVLHIAFLSNRFFPYIISRFEQDMQYIPEILLEKILSQSVCCLHKI